MRCMDVPRGLRLITPTRVICSKAEPLLFLRVRLKQKTHPGETMQTLKEMFEETLETSTSQRMPLSKRCRKWPRKPSLKS